MHMREGSHRSVPDHRVLSMGAFLVKVSLPTIRDARVLYGLACGEPTLFFDFLC